MKFKEGDRIMHLASSMIYIISAAWEASNEYTIKGMLGVFDASDVEAKSIHTDDLSPLEILIYDIAL